MACWAVGDTRVEEFQVRDEHLATSWANDLPVLATPIVLWWTELVAMNLMAPALAVGELTVGAGHEGVQHLAPTGLGETVRVTAELTGADRGKATFDVRAVDSAGVVYRASHTRAVVKRDRMVAALRERKP
ncbi:fluoroacetyl-CoA thioesterase [Saccharomonospora amisosensis]|uniref:Fluoroacetyl-CoA thioesterase n=1 Tax=Saccharomonospora amisosensis TaxID=1128677 RepID=A0A7X5UUB3_9PSEU|nr:hypothetical protein [Saccharomonospora amisosensis]NIJ14280.1 fluoroacetyl-CoA thioesterase [Saccharomonospora amisosensis]